MTHTPPMTAQDRTTQTVRTTLADLRAARRAAHLTQAELARRFGCAPATISRWESGALPLSDANLERLAALVVEAQQQRQQLLAGVRQRLAAVRLG